MDPITLTVGTVICGIGGCLWGAFEVSRQRRLLEAERHRLAEAERLQRERDQQQAAKRQAFHEQEEAAAIKAAAQAVLERLENYKETVRGSLQSLCNT